MDLSTQLVVVFTQLQNLSQMLKLSAEVGEKELVDAVKKSMLDKIEKVKDAITGNKELTEAEKQEMRNGRKIPAIKLVRERTGLGLLESKNLVEAWAKDNIKVDPLVTLGNEFWALKDHFNILKNNDYNYAFNDVVYTLKSQHGYTTDEASRLVNACLIRAKALGLNFNTPTDSGYGV